MTMCMFAYGSNLNLRQMAKRCPGAKPMGPMYLSRSRLVFRGVADVEYAKRGRCPGGLWEITRQNEVALDAYEGVDSGLYRKSYLRARIRSSGRIRPILVYQMNSDAIMPPGEHYLKIIEEGYRDFGLDLAYLDRALVRAWNEKALDEDIMERRCRRRQKDGALASCVPTQDPLEVDL